jgi:predicted lysophospholipase L1 biosynthesis ABC-type transport system permease subunit
MLMSNIKLAWHFFQQEYNHSHQKLLRWVQGVLLLFIVTLSQSSDSIQSYLQQNLQGLLGADVVISQKQPLTVDEYNYVSSLANNITVTQQIKAMLTHNGQWQQAQLKAVDNQYPLQGELLTSLTLQGEGQVSTSGPKPGQIWLDSRLFASLSIEVGEPLIIANKPFLVSQVLQHEPDRLMEGHNVSMRAMINSSDMQGLNFPVDLVQYRYLLAADNQKIAQLIRWQEEQLPAAQIHHKQGKHPLALFWQRTENFLGLASIILFFMAAIAIEQLAQVHMKKDQYFTAVCMSFGASKGTGVQISFLKWLIGGISLLPAVLLLSTGFHYLVISFLHNTFSGLTWQLNLFSAFKSIFSVVVIFAVFHAPIWFSLLNSSVANQFAGINKGLNHWYSKLSSIIVLFIVAFSYSDNGLLTFMMLAVVALTIVLMICISWVSLTLGEKSTQHVSGLIPFALFMMKQRLLSKSTQILGVGLCAFLLLFTLMLLKDLGATMSSYQRQHDGNVFVSQASHTQMNFLENWAKDKEITIRQVKPYINAKLVEINEQSLADFSNKPSDSLSTFSHAIRLHWSESIPSNNRLVNGHWWQSNTVKWQQISVEQEVMTDLGLTLGDKLTFFINKQSYQFEITASHEFKSGAGSITFWVQMPPAALTHIEAAQYSMASLELDDKQWSLLAPIWQKFPTLRMVSLKEITQLFDRTLAMVTQVISGFSLMIILLAAVVILASINSLEAKEKKKNSIIMSFGFSRETCLKLNVIEWLVTATITAVGAIVGTYIAGLLIYQSQFSLTYHPDFLWLALTLFVILTIVTVLGVYASRNNLRSSVRELLASN